MQSSNTDKKENLLLILLIVKITVHLTRKTDKDEAHWFPLQPSQDLEEVAKLPEQFKMQNVHPQLALYDPTIKTGHTSHDELSFVLNAVNETELLKLLSENGVIANHQTCKYCGVDPFAGNFRSRSCPTAASNRVPLR